MHTLTPARAAWRNALSLIILGVLWILFAPSQLGGQVSYVIVNGGSMLPNFHQGDFVLVRQAAEYPVGTIATYNYPGIGPVIHRVVARNGLKYIMKGDNNGWEDAYQPAIEEIMGAYWTHVPGLGDWVTRLRTPLWFSLLVGFSTLLVGVSMQTNVQPKKRFYHRTAAAVIAAGRQMSAWALTWRDGVMTLVYILGLAGALLLIFGWTRPDLRRMPVEIPLTQTAVYTYGASMPPGVYDQNRLDSGSTIFPQLNCTVRMIFSYNLSSQEEAKVEGLHHLIAVVSNTKGWQRTVELGRETPFTGAQVQADGTLDVCALQQMIEDMQQATGVQELQYRLAIYPQVSVKGSLDVFSFTEQFNEPLAFIMEPNQIYLERRQDNQNGLTQTKMGLVTGQVIADNTLPFLSLNLPVRAARIFGMLALLLAGLGFWWVERAAQQAEARDPRRKIAHQMGRPPVRVSCAAFEGRPSVALERLEDLTALANQLGAPVLYAESGGQITFLIDAGETIYRFAPEETAL